MRKRPRLLAVAIEGARSSLISVVVIGLVVAIFCFKLSSLLPGLSTQEAVLQQQVARGSLSGQEIINSPLYLPHQIGLYIIEKAGRVGPAALRLTGALFGAGAALSGIFILRRWHTTRIAVLAGSLLVSSAWLLHSARLADPASAYLLLLPLIAAGVYMRRPNPSLLAVAGFSALVIMVVHLPAMIWLVALIGIWQRRHLKSALLSIRPPVLRIATLFVAAVLLTPLLVAVITDPQIRQLWLGLPAATPSPIEFIKNLVDIPVQLFAVGPDNPVLWAGRAPLLDVFVTATFLLGLYAYFFRRSLDRTKLLVAAPLLLAVFVALGSVPLFALLPFVYLIAAAGVALLLQQWFTVFPRNPIARGIGIALVSVCVALSCLYNLQRYFIAWPRTPETKQQFQTRPLDLVQ